MVLTSERISSLKAASEAGELEFATSAALCTSSVRSKKLSPPSFSEVALSGLARVVDGEVRPALDAGISRGVKVTLPLEADAAPDDSVTTFTFSSDVDSR
jgi:hypothetical protein